MSLNKEKRREENRKHYARKKLIGGTTHGKGINNNNRTNCNRSITWNFVISNNPNCETCLKIMKLEGLI